MATRNVPKGETPDQPAHHDAQHLRGIVEIMHCCGRQAYIEISAVARLALLSLEAPNGHHNFDAIVTALCLIQDKAEDARSQLACEAESVDCAYVDEAEQRRHAAGRAAHAGEAPSAVLAFSAGEV